MAKVVANAIGKPIEVVQISIEELVAGMVQVGIPEALAQVCASFDINTKAGRVATVTDDLRLLTGRMPKPFEGWLAENHKALAAL